MDTPRRPKRLSASSDAVAAGHAWRPSRGYLGLALLIAIGGISLLFFLWMWSGAEKTDDTVVPPTPVRSMVATAPPPAASVSQNNAKNPQPRVPEGDADPTRDLKSYVVRGEKPSMAEVIERLHERGIHSGLGAFSPPGTRPPLVGLAVPENFSLPKGYVRHHQATDDGQRIEAVLMFAPDFQLYDANNKPIDMPKDRVVPPELAPPGLPHRRIVIPAPSEQSGSGR